MWKMVEWRISDFVTKTQYTIAGVAFIYLQRAWYSWCHLIILCGKSCLYTPSHNWRNALANGWNFDDNLHTHSRVPFCKEKSLFATFQYVMTAILFCFMPSCTPSNWLRLLFCECRFAEALNVKFVHGFIADLDELTTGIQESLLTRLTHSKGGVHKTIWTHTCKFVVYLHGLIEPVQWTGQW